ncbi:MAG: PEP-CTERM sorting domain-containing protein [Armatimonadetes bacterium]|nr:PEP-CTERM sorting domain-containing protein [Armatimonadota bacterium]MBX3108673.1 PEP-CTERM sorting domain-containing protein [Fimbriimonadaceae bacterium]
MKGITLLAMAALGPVSFAQVLWDQSNVVNVAGGGTGAIAGANLSQLSGTETLFGWGAQAANTNVMADDFTVGAGGWNITGLRFWSYQTGATTATITGVNFAIDSDLTSVTVNPAATVTTTLTNTYRVATGVTSDANRRLQLVEVSGLNINLSAGTYFLKFNFVGSTANSGPWAPAIPTGQAVNGQNAQQSLAGGAFAPAFVDGGAGPLGGDAVFQIRGQAVPEPATMSLLAVAAAGIAARRRKKS